QRNWLTGDALDAQLSYWRERLHDLPTLDLPTDRPRPPVQSYRGETYTTLYPKTLCDGLLGLSQREGATLFMTLLAAFKVLLRKYTGQDNFAVGSPIANRTRAELEHLIGFFVNSLVMRTDVSGDPTFVDLLSRVRETALGAYEHQDVPFERLVEEANPERDMSRNPLFQIMFAVQNAPRPPLQLSGLHVEQVKSDTTTTRFDLEVHFWEIPQGLGCMFVYSTDLFDESTILRMRHQFQTLLEAIVARPNLPISEFPLMGEEERRQVVQEWNATESVYPRDATIAALFEEQVAARPQAVALEFGEERLTYAELNARANQVARYLQRLGVREEMFVGLCMERSLEMVVATLGILKAGGAYLPLDADYPKPRLRYMLEDARVPVLLMQQHLADNLPHHDAKTVCLDAGWAEIARESTEDAAHEATAESLAYVMYTSGSTGTPKGVCVTHRNVTRLVKNTNYVELNSETVVPQLATISFDAATFELWGPLLNGGKVVLVPRDVTLSPAAFARFLEDHSITTMFVTTALFNETVRQVPEAFRTLKHVMFGGEAADPQWAKRVLDVGKPERLLNVYGPTETTTFATWYAIHEVAEDASGIPIGAPIANTTTYVLDERLKPVPVGVAGELYIGGDGVARGYL
ncbi:MAG: amino acid adenylation domain-containing protein, partial [bacterium]|nr:amino acid adenylation domain-containing protein [bacterium]